MGKTIYFVRHGESEWNVADKICGSTDIPLTDNGREQARITGELFVQKGIRADLIIASPLSRAYETAEIISSITGIPVKADERITEQNFGKWEGTSPRNAAVFEEAKKQFVIRNEGGESMLRLAQRVYNLLDELANDDKTYSLVAHYGIARVVKSFFDEMSNDEFAKYGVPNCSITEFKFCSRDG